MNIKIKITMLLLSFLTLFSFGMKRTLLPAKKRMKQEKTEQHIRNALRHMWDRGYKADACLNILCIIKKHNLYPTQEDAREILGYINQISNIYSSDGELLYILKKKYNL